MDPKEFAYWLQGFFEIAELNNASSSLNDDQVRCIKEHLDLVFVKRTASHVHDANHASANPQIEPISGSGYSGHTSNSGRSGFSC